MSSLLAEVFAIIKQTILQEFCCTVLRLIKQLRKIHDAHTRRTDISLGHNLYVLRKIFNNLPACDRLLETAAIYSGFPLLQDRARECTRRLQTIQTRSCCWK